LRAVVFANGLLNEPHTAAAAIRADDFIIAADGGLYHCQNLALIPDILIGDLDSVEPADLDRLEAAGVEMLSYPTHKDFTDLELALQLAKERGAAEILVFGALGARWDQTLANLLLPAASNLAGSHIVLIDGSQEIQLLSSGETLELHGKRGDTLSLIPVGGDAQGVTTRNLEYPLIQETLFLGASRGISNVFLHDRATVHIEKGLVLCVMIHLTDEGRKTDDE
jgi:thiamine pyrophosphokinase